MKVCYDPMGGAVVIEDTHIHLLLSIDAARELRDNIDRVLEG